MRKHAQLLFRHLLTQWLKKTPQEILLIGALLIFYLMHNLIVLVQMLLEVY